jgi:hypothetical protein
LSNFSSLVKHRHQARVQIADETLAGRVRFRARRSVSRRGKRRKGHENAAGPGKQTLHISTSHCVSFSRTRDVAPAEIGLSIES